MKKLKEKMSSIKSEERPRKTFMIRDILGETELQSKEKSLKLETNEIEAKMKSEKNPIDKRLLLLRDTKKDLPAWIFCTRYSDRPTAG